MKENKFDTVKNAGNKNSIKETIKIIERKIKEAEHYTDITGLCLTLDKELCNAFINILSDYKRVLKENEIYKKNSEIMSKENLSTSEQLKVEIKENFRLKNQLENNRKEYQETYKDVREELKELKKENEELRKELNEENKRCIMLAAEKQDYFEKYKYHLQQNESLTREFSNYIPVQKVKDKIRHYQESQDNYIKKYDEINEGLQAMINVLEELLDGNDTNVGSIGNED